MALVEWMSDVRVVLAVERGHIQLYGDELRARYAQIDVAAVRAKIERIRAQVCRLSTMDQWLLEFDANVDPDVAAVAVDQVTFGRPLPDSPPAPTRRAAARRRSRR